MGKSVGSIAYEAGLPLPIKFNGEGVVVDEDIYFGRQRVIKKKERDRIEKINESLKTIYGYDEKKN